MDGYGFVSQRLLGLLLTSSCLRSLWSKDNGFCLLVYTFGQTENAHGLSPVEGSYSSRHCTVRAYYGLWTCESAV